LLPFFDSLLSRFLALLILVMDAKGDDAARSNEALEKLRIADFAIKGFLFFLQALVVCTQLLVRALAHYQAKR